MKGETLFRNIARVLAANFWIALVGFLGTFIFPQILTIDDYAWYHTFTLYVGYIGILHLGFPSGMVVNYAGQDYNKIDKEQYKSEVIIILLIHIVFTAIFVSLFFLMGNKMLLYVALAVIPLGIIGSYKFLLQSWSRFKYFSRMSTFLASSVPIIALLYYFIAGSLPGDAYIILYIVIHWFVTILVLFDVGKKIIGVKAKRLISKENWETEKTGLALVAGNYINTLFISADKQFVNYFFDKTAFAYYSFGMSMQNLMTIFIYSVSQPLFPAMAQGKFSDVQYNSMKKILLSFGAFSSCAYFAASFIVKMFIQKYIGSLEVIGIYFILFPAMAVIQCLYINLYKINGMMKIYVKTLVLILLIAVALNLLFIKIMNSFLGVAIATAITYYIWLFIGVTQFGFLRFDWKDYLFLILYAFEYFAVKLLVNDVLKFVVSFVFIVTLILLLYKKEFKMLLKRRE